jgi:hypothetical protein
MTTKLNAAMRLSAADATKGTLPGETVEKTRAGVLHLFKNGMPRVFANWKQANEAAERTGGEAYQSPQSRRFLVRYQG